MIRLIEPVEFGSSTNALQFDVLGQQWAISEYPELADSPPFTCISYAWGKQRMKSPLNPEQEMSSRTIRVLEVAINASRAQEDGAGVQKTAALGKSSAFWMDALCVPADDPHRTVCLQSMGDIFSSALHVVAVLGNQCSAAVRNAVKNEEIAPDDLLVLEQEDWISRAWTYQEAVNSRRLSFVAEGERSGMVSGHDFLNAVMIAIDKYKSQNGLDDDAWEKRSGRLRSLERLLADYRISDYATRSAYQVMSVMDERFAERPEDHFYAMVGSIAASERVDGDEDLTPSEYFMRVCERKADFSFIYSTAPRDDTVGRRWRPTGGRFPTVLPNLITFGSSERGIAHATHLSLENMYRLQPGPIGSAGLKSVRWFARASDSCTSSEDVALRTLERLRTLGFGGTGEYLEFETGFFFPQSASDLSDGVFAVVSSDIHWVTGGPGLLLRTGSSGIYEFCDTGAFVGKSPKSGQVINVD